MSTTALGVAPDEDGNGVTPLTHRRTQMYQWACTGVIGGLEVSGSSSSLKYTVSAGCAVTSRGDSDGYALAYSEGGTVTTTAGSSSNDRYDVVWIKSDDLDQGDDDNLVTLGVTQGTASSSPTIPSIPTGAQAVDTLLVPAGMTYTSAAESTGEIDYAIPYGSSLGLLAKKTQTTNAEMSSSWEGSTKASFSVPTDRWIEAVFDCRTELVDAGDWPYSDLALQGSCYLALYIDGEAVDDTNDKFYVSNQWLRQQISELVFVEKGSHTAQWKTKPQSNAYGDYYWRGIRNTYIYDRGVGND